MFTINCHLFALQYSYNNVQNAGRQREEDTMFSISGFLALIIILLILLSLLGFSCLAGWLGNDDHYRGLH